MTRPRSTRLLQIAAVMSLVGLALMVWSMLDPRPIPVMAAMTVGQGIGTASFLLYIVVVIHELRQKVRDDRNREEPPG